MGSGLSGISGATDGWHGQLGPHVAATAQTPGHAAVSALMPRWAATLPHFGLAGGCLRAAMHGAARVCAQSDAAVAQAADDGKGSGS